METATACAVVGCSFGSPEDEEEDEMNAITPIEPASPLWDPLLAALIPAGKFTQDEFEQHMLQTLRQEVCTVKGDCTLGLVAHFFSKHPQLFRLLATGQHISDEMKHDLLST
jgi:hypothetical protein